jgi:hypothetical protein
MEPSDMYLQDVCTAGTSGEYGTFWNFKLWLYISLNT